MKNVVLFENHAILSLVGTMTAAVAVIGTLQTLLNLTKGVVEALIKAICLKADLSFCPRLVTLHFVQVICSLYWHFELGQFVLLCGNSRRLPKLFTFISSQEYNNIE